MELINTYTISWTPLYTHRPQVDFYNLFELSITADVSVGPDIQHVYNDENQDNDSGKDTVSDLNVLDSYDSNANVVNVDDSDDNMIIHVHDQAAILSLLSLGKPQHTSTTLKNHFTSHCIVDVLTHLRQAMLQKRRILALSIVFDNRLAMNNVCFFKFVHFLKAMCVDDCMSVALCHPNNICDQHAHQVQNKWLCDVLCEFNRLESLRWSDTQLVQDTWNNVVRVIRSTCKHLKILHIDRARPTSDNIINLIHTLECCALEKLSLSHMLQWSDNAWMIWCQHATSNAAYWATCQHFCVKQLGTLDGYHFGQCLKQMKSLRTLFISDLYLCTNHCDDPFTNYVISAIIDCNNLNHLSLINCANLNSKNTTSVLNVMLRQSPAIPWVLNLSKNSLHGCIYPMFTYLIRQYYLRNSIRTHCLGDIVINQCQMSIEEIQLIDKFNHVCNIRHNLTHVI